MEPLAAGGDREAATVGKVAFLYPGEGSEWAGMGRELYESEPVFREVLERCEAVVREERNGSLLAVMFGEEEGLDRTEWTQPALYALGSGLTALWASVGVRPDAVFGHGAGEIAAMQAAGGFDLEDGQRFAARRGSLLGSLPEGGATAAVFASEDRVAEALSGSVSLAADYGTHCVVSGPEAEVAALVSEFEASGVRVERLRSRHAFHGALVEPVLDDLESAVGEVSAPSVPLVSGVNGRVLAGVPEGAYWRRQAREPVRFRGALGTLSDLEMGVLIEMGPDAVLGPMALSEWPEETGPAVVSSLGREGSGAFAAAVGAAYEAGLELAFEGLFAGEERRRVALPTYPFQRERHWVELPKRYRPGSGHSLLGIRRDGRDGETSFETELYAVDPAWIADHRVFGEVVAPGALYASQGIEALVETGRGSGVALAEVQIRRPLVLPSEVGRTVQVLLDGKDRFEVVSREGSGPEWRLHAEGRVGTATGGGEALDVEGLREGLAAVEVQELYRGLASHGIAYEGVFRSLEGLWSGEREALGEVRLPEAASREGLRAHPALLDGCFQVLGGCSELTGEGGLWLPFGWDRLWLSSVLPERLVCRARLREGEGEMRKADLGLYTGSGARRWVGWRDSRSSGRAGRRCWGLGVEELLYGVEWRGGGAGGSSGRRVPCGSGGGGVGGAVAGRGS